MHKKLCAVKMCGNSCKEIFGILHIRSIDAVVPFIVS